MSLDKLPDFTFNLENLEDRLKALLDANLKTIEALIQDDKIYTFDNLMLVLDEIDDELEKFWSPVGHLHAVMNTESLRNIYKACLPILSAYETKIGHNKRLYEAIASIDKHSLNQVQSKLIKDTLLNFELSGVALSADHKKRFEIINARLSELSNLYEMNLLDATTAFSYAVTDAAKLKGLPEHALATAKQTAEAKNLEGWIFNLEFPSYSAVITHAEDRELREIFYRAYVTKASDQGPHAGKFDNSPVMDEILALRDEEAKLLGYSNYAELSLSTKMAESTEKVIEFLTDLGEKGFVKAGEEFEKLKNFARTELQFTDIAAWDLAWLSEKLRQKEHEISEELLRPWLPFESVMSGFFEIMKTLFGLRFEQIQTETWHQDVVCYQILDASSDTRGYVYLDLFARPNKRGGAWMGSFQTRCRRTSGQIQLPIATLTCNFAKPFRGQALLSHDEVITLFHEFGHCLHHLLTKVDYYSCSGINGVEWDAVELPSQLFENWAWDKEALQHLTKHIETGLPLPQAIFDKLLASKNFQSAMALMRQIEFALFDFRIHAEYKKDDPDFIASMIKAVRKTTRVVPAEPFDRFQNGFSHIFAGGYAAGYYSYKWAEVLSADAWSRFEEEGVLNARTGHAFLEAILEKGSSRPAKESFREFRGRDPEIEPLLRQSGVLD